MGLLKIEPAVVNSIAGMLTDDPELFVGDPGVTESDIPGFQPSAQIGGDPLISALTKIHRGIAGGELDRGYTGPSIVMQKFGLDPTEMSNIQQKGILEQDPESKTWGFGRKYEMVQKGFKRSHPAITHTQKQQPQPQMQPAPPPPSPRDKPMMAGVSHDLNKLLAESNIR